jgi:hypothetical protein
MLQNNDLIPLACLLIVNVESVTVRLQKTVNYLYNYHTLITPHHNFFKSGTLNRFTAWYRYMKQNRNFVGQWYHNVYGTYTALPYLSKDHTVSVEIAVW